MDVKRFTLNDGRRAEERVSETELTNGEVEQVVEVREEAIPMKVTKKVTKRMVTVPVSEKVEVFEDDGSVATTVRSVNDAALDLRDREGSVTLSDLADKVDTLARSLTQPVVAAPPVSASNIATQLRAKFAKIDTSLSANDELVIEEERPATETTTNYVFWGVVAFLGAGLYYWW